MSFGQKATWSSIVAVVVLVFLLVRQDKDTSSKGQEELFFYCAAGIKPPVEAAVKQYEKEYGVRIQLQYGGSGTLLSNIKVAKRGDLYLAADNSYTELARKAGLAAEEIPLAHMRPVIAVRKGNPRNIRGIKDLLRDDVAVVLANPDAAAIGKTTRKLLQKTGQWAQLEPKVKVFKPTVMEVANDLKIGAVDAGVIWDATANQYPELESVSVPEFASGRRLITVAVMTSTRMPTAALRFARYLGAPGKGSKEFSRFGYVPVDGDTWAVTPKIVLFSGGVNRLAIEETLKGFEKREGVQVERVYNGCGILVAEMKAGKKPDAYFACDSSFMTQVSDLFVDPVSVANTDMVIITQKGNPKAIQALADLGKEGLKVGVANEKQSALGALTKTLLQKAGVYELVIKNVKTQTPTADLLVNQARVGALDAAIVYRANTAYARDYLEVIAIDHEEAHAVQPIAVARQTAYPQLTRRLKQALMSAKSKEKFESVGFNWMVDEGK